MTSDNLAGTGVASGSSAPSDDRDHPDGGDHDNRKGHYDQSYYEANGQLGDRPALRWYTQLATRYLGRGPVLDVGCGTGHFLRRLAQTGPADGLEVSDYSASAARQTSPSSDVFTDPAALPAGRYSRFTGIHVVEHLTDGVLDELLTALRRAAAPGARYLFVTPDLSGAAQRLHGTGWNAYTDPTHINLKTHTQWRRVFTDSGFQILREGSDGLWNVPYSHWPKPLDAARYSLPMAAQFLSGRLWLKPGTGESSLFVVR